MLVVVCYCGHMMTKQNFEAMANLISAERAMTTPGSEAWHRVRGLAFSMSDYFYRNNPRFDRMRFYAACGFESH